MPAHPERLGAPFFSLPSGRAGGWAAEIRGFDLLFFLGPGALPPESSSGATYAPVPASGQTSERSPERGHVLVHRVPLRIYKRAALGARHRAAHRSWISPPLFPLDGPLGTGPGLSPAPAASSAQCDGVDYLRL